MTQCYICSLGTSVANGCKALRVLQASPLGWDDVPAKGEEAAAAADSLKTFLDGRVRELTGKGADDTLLRQASAELNVLLRRPKRLGWKGVRIVLLATDTFLGRRCGEALGKILKTVADGAGVTLTRVPGLQVLDGERLRQEGVGALLEATRREIEAARSAGAEVIICPNGGYKGVVPFLTLMGMFHRCRVQYVFEFAETAISLPPLPFSLDMDLYGRASEALRELTEAVEMPEGEFFSRIAGYREAEQDLFRGFVLPGSKPGSVTPNPLFEALADAAAQTPTVMLSPKARKDLEKCGEAAQRQKFLGLLVRSQDPTWCEGHLHPLHTTDLLAIKRVGSSTERLLGYMHQGRFYVARVLAHDEYDRVTTGKALQQKDYPPESFEPYRFTPGDCAAANLAEETVACEALLEQAYEASRRDREALRRSRDEYASLEESAKRAAEKQHDLERELASCRNAQISAETERDSLKAQIEAFRGRTFAERVKDLFRKP